MEHTASEQSLKRPCEDNEALGCRGTRNIMNKLIQCFEKCRNTLSVASEGCQPGESAVPVDCQHVTPPYGCAVQKTRLS
jgi:hypothetical protein